MGSPRVDVVFCIWQCDKENHGWREGPPVTVLCQSFRSAGRAFTLRLNQFERKQEYCLVLFPATPTQNIGRFKSVIQPESGKRCTFHVCCQTSIPGFTPCLFELYGKSSPDKFTAFRIAILPSY